MPGDCFDPQTLPPLSMSSLIHAADMAAIGACRCKFTQLMAHHVLGYIDGHMSPSHHEWQIVWPTICGNMVLALDQVLITCRPPDAFKFSTFFKQLRINKGSFF